MDLNDEHWAVVKPLLPKAAGRSDGRGRPRVNDREILNGILWILRTVAPWHDMPERYSPYQTCHRRFRLEGAVTSQEWVHAGVLDKLLWALARDVKVRGGLDLTECFMVTVQTTFDGTFVIAKKGGAGWEKPSGARVQSSWRWQTSAGLPIAIYIGSASPHEVKLVEMTLRSRFTKERPERLIGNRAYDSDPLDQRLHQHGIQMIAPHKTNRKGQVTQAGRPLRRYRKRWKIERLFAWLQNFRRIGVRRDRILENYIGFSCWAA